MVNYQELLDQRLKRRVELLQQLQQLDQQRQMILNEILRLEGEIRLLQDLINKTSINKNEIV